MIFIAQELHDISQRKAAEARSRRLANLYAALSQCNQAIVHCTSEVELFPKICRCAVDYGFAKMAWIGFVNEEGTLVEPVASYGDDTGYLDDLLIPMDVENPLSRAPATTSIRDDQAIWYQDFAHVHIPLRAPLLPCHITQAGSHQHQSGGPSGKLPTTLARRRISRFKRSKGLFA